MRRPALCGPTESTFTDARVNKRSRVRGRDSPPAIYHLHLAVEWSADAQLREFWEFCAEQERFVGIVAPLIALILIVCLCYSPVYLQL